MVAKRRLAGLSLRTPCRWERLMQWTGIGAVGTALLGMLLFAESREVARLVCIGLIVAGIVGLKWATPD